MKKRWVTLLIVLGLAGAAMLLSCSDNSEDNNPPPPPPLVGQWNATQATLDTLGLNEYVDYFNSDYSYRYFRRAGSTSIDELGTWDTIGDSIQFHATSRDNIPVNDLYARRYALSQSNNVLTVHHIEDGQLYIATFTRVEATP